MYLSPTEEDRLRIFTAAELARRTRADGVQLSAPEATALICDEMHRAARAGGTLEAVLAAGRSAVSADDVMDGVPALVSEIRMEVLLDDGRRLVVLRDSLTRDASGQPGETRHPERDIAFGAGKPRLHIRVTSRSSRPIRVSSHYPFWRANPRLHFDRAATEGYRLDIPAGAAVRWAPGETKEVDLVALRPVTGSDASGPAFPSNVR
jgi:urease subunit gamma/beta